MKTILILAPHTDDGELGCGGTIARYINEGHRVIYAAFSTCSQSLPQGFAPDTLRTEVTNATAVLGILPQDLIIFDYEVRRFKEARQNILDDIVSLNKKHEIDMVFVPSPTDIHQDHEVIYEEGLRGFKNKTIFGYEMPWNNISFNARSFIKLKKEHIDKKVLALQEYVSQNGRPYTNETFIRSLATVRGTQIGCEYAEAFDIIRMIIN
ncbi:PIG-L deacetylase family protein [Pinibacter aurantiacus]|uniref:PIG-L family deacetylase n=1 Tax=Pinibacter aurantiacus TaxID=2851599 RepID=A0A9E2SBB7_9BACT|nr:PIG-L deacetylase family protein [Pinibacter aurantiacus]MBV4358318.1 PIG-L family deacetylase [Pinibacter aurantiacus]